MNTLRPIVDNLRDITRILPPQIEEVYEKLLWIRGKVKDAALDKTWVQLEASAFPDIEKVIE